MSYIVIEGSEGVGKTTQVKMLNAFLKNKGYSVLETKEPGTPHSPLTMDLRSIMLSNAYDDQLTDVGREFISQAIRSIHLEKVIVPAMERHDFIVQDRGLLSGISYAVACGHDEKHVEHLMNMVAKGAGFTSPYLIYSDTILLLDDVETGLNRARSCKQEFSEGDAIESRKVEFFYHVTDNMLHYIKRFNRAHVLDVRGASIETVHEMIVSTLGLESR